MTEERSCRTCRLSSFNNGTGKACGSVGVSDCIGYAKWQPIAQEKPMKNKVIFESEEQLRKFVDDCIFIDEDENNMDDIVQYARIGNYIRKTAVEEAEEMYDNMIKNYSTTCGDFKIAVDYINILKSEIARLGK